MKYLIFLMPLLLASCSMQMQQSSQAWDDAPTAARFSQHRIARWQGQRSIGGESSPTSPAEPPADKSQQRTSVPSSRSEKASTGSVRPPELGNFGDFDAPFDKPSKGPSSDILSTAEQYLGVPYVYGGHTPEKGFDCSGLVFHVFQQRGISIQRTADKQFLQGQEVSPDKMQPGDLVFFSHSGKYVDHVGIYAGNDLFIHAPRTGRTVSYDSLNTGYYQTHFRGAKRFF